MRRKLQVFVSSTFSDMIEERQAAVETILRAGHIPAGMELFTAGDQSQMAVIKRWIDESDVYMLVLGARYGSIEPLSGISYTELEYDYAVEQRKPLFAIVIDENAIDEKGRRLGTGVLELTHGSALAQFRQKVLMRMSAFYAEPKDVRLAIFHALPEFAADEDLKGWVWGGDVPDTDALQSEIRKLRDENAILRENASLGTRSPQSMTGIADMDDVIETLRGIAVEIPANINTPKEKEITTLLDAMLRGRDSLVSGVTNAGDTNEFVQYLYFNIMPKLAVHGLSNNESVAGTRYRRSYLNEKGLAVLAELDSRSVRSKKGSEATDPAHAAKT